MQELQLAYSLFSALLSALVFLAATGTLLFWGNRIYNSYKVLIQAER